MGIEEAAYVIGNHVKAYGFSDKRLLGEAWTTIEAELRRLQEMEQRVNAGLVNSSRKLGEYMTMCQKLGDLLGVPGGQRHLDTLVPAVEKLVKSDTALSEK